MDFIDTTRTTALHLQPNLRRNPPLANRVDVASKSFGMFHEAVLDLFNQHDYQVLKDVVGIVWADLSRKKPFSRAKDAESSRDCIRAASRDPLYNIRPDQTRTGWRLWIRRH